MGKNFIHFKRIRNFALTLMSILITCTVILAFTPLMTIWFHHISGLSRELTDFAKIPFRITILVPGLMVLNSLLRSVLVNARSNTPISWATGIEVVAISAVMMTAVSGLNAVGAIAAAMAMTIGRSAALIYLVRPVYSVLKR